MGQAGEEVPVVTGVMQAQLGFQQVEDGCILRPSQLVQRLWAGCKFPPVQAGKPLPSATS